MKALWIDYLRPSAAADGLVVGGGIAASSAIAAMRWACERVMWAAADSAVRQLCIHSRLFLARTIHFSGQPSF